MRLWKIIHEIAAVIGIITIIAILILGAIIIKAREARRAESLTQSEFDDINIRYFSVDTAQSLGQIINSINESYDMNIDNISHRFDSPAILQPPKAVLYINLDNNTTALFLDYFLDCGCRTQPLIRCNMAPDSASGFIMNGSMFLRFDDLEYYVYQKEYIGIISGTGQ